MGDVLASDIIDEAATIIYDESNVRWPTADMLMYLNSAQYQVVNIKPEVGTKTSAILGAQQTRQTLPADGIMFYRVNRNMGSNGATPGKTIKIASIDDMDSELDDWHTDTATVEAEHYIFRESDPKTYYLWPQPAVGRYHELVYSASPAKINAVTDNITIDNIYRNALVDWVLYSAYRKNNAISGNAGRASAAASAFYRSMGMKERAEAKNDPNLKAEKAQKVRIT